MATVSKSFTAVGNSNHLVVPKGQSFTYSVSGTFVGTVKLERIDVSGNILETVASATGSASGTVNVPVGNDTHHRFRFRCSAFTSGTIVTSLADAVDVEAAKSIRDQNGADVLQVQDGGINLPGTLGVTGLATLPVINTLATVEAVAAAGSAQGDAGAPTSTSFPLFIHATGADATKGVVLPAAAAGRIVFVKNADAANAILKLYPASGDAINALSADAALSMAAKTSAVLVALDSTTWYSIPLLPS